MGGFIIIGGPKANDQRQEQEAKLRSLTLPARIAAGYQRSVKGATALSVIGSVAHCADFFLLRFHGRFRCGRHGVQQSVQRYKAFDLLFAQDVLAI